MRRFANMNNSAKMAIGATAMMAVAVVGVTLWPSSSASATAQPGSSPTAVSVGPASDSLAARRRVAFTEDGVRFSFSVPPRIPREWAIYKSISTDKVPGGPISLNKDVVGPQGAEAIIYWTSFPDGDYADPCARLLSPSTGASAAKLATAVSRAPGTKLVKGPSDITLGGRPAKHVVLTVRENVGCNPGFFYTWPAEPGGTFWRTTVGDTIRVWIVAVNRTRLFIAAATNEEATPSIKKEIQQIVESIRFD